MNAPTEADAKEVWNAYAEARGAQIVHELQTRASPLPVGQVMPFDMGRQIGLEFVVSPEPLWRWATRAPTLTATGDDFILQFRQWCEGEPAKARAAELGVRLPYFETRAEAQARWATYRNKAAA